MLVIRDVGHAGRGEGGGDAVACRLPLPGRRPYSLDLHEAAKLGVDPLADGRAVVRPLEGDDDLVGGLVLDPDSAEIVRLFGRDPLCKRRDVGFQPEPLGGVLRADLVAAIRCRWPAVTSAAAGAPSGRAGAFSAGGWALARPGAAIRATVANRFTINDLRISFSVQS
jgi:hypothetical protein